MFSARTLNATIPEVENVSAISFCISEVSIKFWIFWKKGWGSWFRYFPSFRLQKTWLPKCLKSLVSVHLRTVKIVKSGKHCWKMHGSSFDIFFHHSERTSVRKTLCQVYPKSWDSLLTYLVPMRSIMSR